MEINRAEVVAELTEAFEQYEQALLHGDNRALAGYFWKDHAVVRFGLQDQQRGIDELRQWRLRQPPVPPGRRLFDTVVTTFGSQFGVVTTGFTYLDKAGTGRQSQTWARLDTDWVIVSAHVSWVTREV